MISNAKYKYCKPIPAAIGRQVGYTLNRSGTPSTGRQANTH